MPTFSWTVDYGASNEVKPKVLKSQFGDGYEQRLGDGINNLPRKWTLVFTKTSTEMDDIENFLIARAAIEHFDWVPPRGPTGKWICDEWKRGVSNAAYDNLSTSFREVFEP